MADKYLNADGLTYYNQKINEKFGQVMTGATGSADGKAGLVPKPGYNDTKKFLKGDGTWSDVVVKLDGIAYADNSNSVKMGDEDYLNVSNTGFAIGSSSFKNGTISAVGPGAIAGGNVYLPTSSTYTNPLIEANGKGAIALGSNWYESASDGTMIYPLKATGVGSIALGVGCQATSDSTQAGYGAGGIAIGNRVSALSGEAVALGYLGTASGRGAFSAGINCKSTGYGAISVGGGSKAEGTNSVAIGNGSDALAANTISMGTYNTVSHTESYAFGKNLTSTEQNQILLGRYNKTPATSSFPYRFIFGDSVSSTSTNLMTLQSNGNLSIKGSLTQNASDYAECFEWDDGNPNKEDRIGYIVTLEGNKIRFADSTDDILGIISGTAGIIGNAAFLDWQGQYLTDEYGRIIYDEVEYEEEVGQDEDGPIYRKYKELSPRINPDFDSTLEYVPRTERPEWGVVGLMGQIYVRDNGLAVIGGYVTPTKGIATPSLEPTRMRVMERINDHIIRVFFK